MKQIKEFIKENLVFFIVIITTSIIFNIPLPYYISAPGGVIDIENRIKVNNKEIDKDGSLNMLYVSEYNGTVGSYIIAKVLKNWDINKIEEKQVIETETLEQISTRNKLLLKQSIQSATLVAFDSADKEVKINSKENIVLINLKNNDLKIGDVVLKVEDIEIDNINDIRIILDKKEENDKVKLLVKRNDKELEIEIPVSVENNQKILGVVLYTYFDYELKPKIELKFKDSESGSSGGLMMALSIYNAISDEDIIKGRDIAGTGTIDSDGNVGKIDGIKYKIIGAYKNKMDIVLVPKDNYEEAKKINEENNYNLKLVKVEKFEDAIEYLKK